MVTVYAPRAILKCHLYQDSPSVQQTYTYPFKINNVNFVNCNPAFPKPPFGSPCSNNIFHSSFSWKCEKQHKSLHLFHHVATHKWLVISLPFFFIYFIITSLVDLLLTFYSLGDWYVFGIIIFMWMEQQCGLQDSISSDDEYRSSRNIAISLFRRYRNFIDRGGADNLKVLLPWHASFIHPFVGSFSVYSFQLTILCVFNFLFRFQEFITAGVNAYALGCTDEGLRKELTDLKDSGTEIEAMQSYGGSTSLKSKIISEEVVLQFYINFNHLVQLNLSHESWLSQEFL